MPIPFHTSGAFLVVPLRWRKEFLFRNPDVRVLLSALNLVHGAARIIFEQFGPSYSSKTARAKWEAFSFSPFNALEYRVSQGLTVAYGLRPVGHAFDRLYGPCAAVRFQLGPADAGLYRNLWGGLVHFGFPDVTISQWQAAKGRALEGEIDALAAEHGCEPTGDQLNIRGRRRVKGFLAKCLRRLGLPLSRQRSDGYYARLLAVWDAREGWDGNGYNLGQTNLNTALARAGGRGDEDYHRAFQLVVGEEYDADLHRTIFGAGHTPQEQAIANRRRSGRPRGSAEPTAPATPAGDMAQTPVANDPESTLAHRDYEWASQSILNILQTGGRISPQELKAIRSQCQHLDSFVWEVITAKLANG
jgi:hypothetical protein